MKEVKEEVRRYFIEKFKEPGLLTLEIEFVEFRKLYLEDRDVLEEPFSEMGIKEVVWGCEGNKIPRLDGYNFEFIKRCWNILKLDVIQFLQEFHSKTILSKVITCSFLTLIPKSKNPQGLEDYIPILSVGDYNILSKFCTSRLKRFLRNIISHNQSAFVPGRQLFDQG